MSVDFQRLFNEAKQQGLNPFRQKTIVSSDEVWGEVMTDLPSLNDHVDQKLEQAISDVRNRYISKLGVLIKGDVGTGKSHAIYRIRRKIDNQGGCFFAYIPPYTHATRINSHVRLYLTLSLHQRNSHGITQWQKLAAAVIKTLEKTEFSNEYKDYIEKCDQPNELRKLINENHRDRNDLLRFFDGLVEAILEDNPKLDFSFLKSSLFLILKTAPLAQIGLAWLIGEDFPGTKEAGLPELSPEQQEDKSVWFIQQMCALAEVVNHPVLLCFDQLDSAVANADSGDSPAMVIAKCIDRIYFQCNNIILICCALNTMWEQVQALGGGISERVGQQIVSTKPPTAEQMLELVQLRLDCFYATNQLKLSDFPQFYPFDENEIRQVAAKAASTRQFMLWCADKFDSNTSQSAVVNEKNTKEKIFQSMYEELLKQSQANDKYVQDKDDDRLAIVISNAMRMLSLNSLSSTLIEYVEVLESPLHDVHFIISAFDLRSQQPIRIGVRVCDTQQSKTFNAVMKRMLDYEKHQASRNCLVRSTKIPKSWKVGNQLKQQLEDKGGEVVSFKLDDVKPLFIIQRIYEEAGNTEDDSLNGFTKTEIIELVKKSQLLLNNYLLDEILSAPAKQ